MILTSLPNIASYKSDQPIMERNQIISSLTTGKYSYPEHRTPYLFVTNQLEKGIYSLNSKPIEISERSFYFLNAGDYLEINFARSQSLQTFLILFETKFVIACFSLVT